MLQFRNLKPEEITAELFVSFDRKQTVNNCKRKVNGKWMVISDPFIDDWDYEDYLYLVSCLKNTASTGGMVCGAFIDNKLKGFVSVEGELTGSHRQYMDLSSIHVSQEMRGKGIGRKLFEAAKTFAKNNNAEKLYISAHSAVESQAFYTAMGCKEAEEYDLKHVKKEPNDCQLEFEL